MRISYRTLAKLIDRMSESQKDCDVMVEYYDGQEKHYMGTELRIAGESHDILPVNHPIMYSDCDTACKDNQVDNVDEICQEIGLDV